MLRLHLLAHSTQLKIGFKLVLILALDHQIFAGLITLQLFLGFMTLMPIVILIATRIVPQIRVLLIVELNNIDKLEQWNPIINKITELAVSAKSMEHFSLLKQLVVLFCLIYVTDSPPMF